MSNILRAPRVASNALRAPTTPANQSYIGCSSPQLPPGKLPSVRDVLRQGYFWILLLFKSKIQGSWVSERWRLRWYRKIAALPLKWRDRTWWLVLWLCRTRPLKGIWKGSMLITEQFYSWRKNQLQVLRQGKLSTRRKYWKCRLIEQ